MIYKTSLFTGHGACYADNTDPRTVSRLKLCQGGVMFAAGVGKCERCGIVNRLVEKSAAPTVDLLGNVLTIFRADPPKQARTVQV